MRLLKEQFRSMYKGMSISCSPEAFRRNTKFLMSKHDLPKGQAMAAAYAVLSWACERTPMQARAGAVKESNPLVLKSFMRPEELAEAEWLVQMLREEPLTESVEPKRFTGVYEVNLAYIPERWNSNIGENLPEAWEARVDKVEFRRGAERAFESDAPVARGLFGQGSTWLEAIGALKLDMEKAGYRGLLRVNHSDGKSDTMVLKPKLRLTEERVMDELKEISEIEALVKKVGSLSEQQRPAVDDVTQNIEADLKKGILVSLARMMREMGYDRWPHDAEGRADIEAVIKKMEKSMLQMSRRFHQLMRTELNKLKQKGPKQYEQIIRRWLAGQPGDDMDGAQDKDSEAGDLKKVAEDGDVQFEPMDKETWDGMSKDERADYVEELGLITGPDDVKAADITGLTWRDLEEQHPDMVKAIIQKSEWQEDGDEPEAEKKDEPKDAPEKKAEPVAESKKKVLKR